MTETPDHDTDPQEPDPPRPDLPDNPEDLPPVEEPDGGPDADEMAATDVNTDEPTG